METLMPDIPYRTKSIKVETPDGTMFVDIVENERGNPIKFIIHIGKTGTSLAAWANAVAELASRLVQKEGIHVVLEEVSGITSSNVRARNGDLVRSGPEGFALALLKYTQLWFKENEPQQRSGRSSIGKRE